jgi:hypothetical protein
VGDPGKRPCGYAGLCDGSLGGLTLKVCGYGYVDVSCRRAHADTSPRVDRRAPVPAAGQ